MTCVPVPDIVPPALTLRFRATTWKFAGTFSGNWGVFICGLFVVCRFRATWQIAPEGLVG
jgi:hypothetical protein